MSFRFLFLCLTRSLPLASNFFSPSNIIVLLAQQIELAPVLIGKILLYLVPSLFVMQSSISRLFLADLNDPLSTADYIFFPKHIITVSVLIERIVLLITM